MGTVTATEHAHGSVRRVVFTWATTGIGDSGAASGTTATVYDGAIVYCKAHPGASPPAAGYDVTLTDADGSDVLGGLFINADHEADVVKFRPDDDLLYVASSKLTLNVSSAGALAVAGGTVTVYVR
jgi:hypothetical protein